MAVSAWPAVAFIGSVETVMGMVRSARRAEVAEDVAEPVAPRTPRPSVVSVPRQGKERSSCPTGAFGSQSSPDAAALLDALAASPSASVASVARVLPGAEDADEGVVDGAAQILAAKSFHDGYAEGQSIGLPNESEGEREANCRVTQIEDMPMGDNTTSWMTGCLLGSTVAS